MNKEEANRQVQELFGSTSTLVSVEPGCAHLDGAATANQLRHLAFIVEALTLEEREIEIEGPLEMIRWGGPEDHFKDYKSFWEGGRQTVRVDICDILEEMGFELPPEGSREQHDVQEQLTALTPQFEVVSKLFIGRICNRTAIANLKAAHKTIIQDAVEHGLLRLRRKP